MADETAAATAEAETTTSTDGELEGVLKDADNPDAVKNAIDRQKAEAKAAKQRADALEAELQQYKDRDKTEQQKKDEAAAAAETRATAAETKLLRFEVAAEKNIPLKHAHRLVGSTKEELAQDADELAKELKANDEAPDFGSGARSAATTNDMDTLIRARR